MSNLHDSLQRLRAALPVMQAEQRALPADSVFRPSPMWEDLNGFFDFVFDFSDTSLLNIRLHTSLMTGDPWFIYMAHAGIVADEQKLGIPMIKQYHELTKDIPDRYWGSEPVTTRQIESVGLRYRGRLVSDDIARYQRCVTNIYRAGVFRRLATQEPRPIIVEVGGGYGGLAHQITRALERPATYVIFDLPDMLYWSAAFLAVNNPDKRFYVYPGSGADQTSFDDICAAHDFVFFPNFAFDRLAELREFHLFVNTLSFQEMTDAQVETYAARAAQRLRGAIYSENRSRHAQNPDLDVIVDDILARHFVLTPDPELWRRLYPNANTFTNPQYTWQLFPYIGHARGDHDPIEPIDRVIHLSDRRVVLDEVPARG